MVKFLDQGVLIMMIDYDVIGYWFIIDSFVNRHSVCLKYLYMIYTYNLKSLMIHKHVNICGDGWMLCSYF